MKKTLVIIHGGTTFDTYEEYLEYLVNKKITLESLNRSDWKQYLRDELPEFETMYLQMPNSKNAQYLEWKIWFEKVIPLLHDESVLVGHSLGGIFLAKYLSENTFTKKISQLHLVAAPYDTEIVKDSLGSFALNKKVSFESNSIDSIFIYQSKDDVVVAYQDALKYQNDIPNAVLISFENKGHFLQESFPELVENIRKGI